MKKKVLIMFATYGTGHKAVANNIAEYLKKYKSYEVMLIDTLAYSSKIIGPFTNKFYNTIMFKLPWLWEIIYRTTDNKALGKVGAEFQTKAISNTKLKKEIINYNPDLVIATHFTAATFVSKLKKRGELNSHLISIVTDYKAHRIWLDSYKSEDALIVNSNDEKKDLIKQGIPANIIKTFGIPLSSKYTLSLYNRNTLLKKFKLDGSKPIVLFYGGGGNGSTTTLPYLNQVINLKLNAEIIFVCGRSEELKYKAEELVKKSKATNIHVLGYITNGPEYVFVSDFVITKPGGSTITECLCFNKPMLLIKNAGGQERDNHKFLTENDYALNGRLLLLFRYNLKKMINNPFIIKEMSRKMNEIDRESSMKKLYELIENILKK